MTSLLPAGISALPKAYASGGAFPVLPEWLIHLGARTAVVVMERPAVLAAFLLGIANSPDVPVAVPVSFNG
ncbi:hypothetical protein FsymDg_3476 [Candidatus Protofrankia datiscae]|uniref:Uncharacterized protein n=1 Tax=Candidatus Protofrankia datiscae TaxID=2716812 RepID=F8AV70_9ACTN|nr:hypothetical protein FsymDg_3476 [Candidatus Protofrankia datiscae]